MCQFIQKNLLELWQMCEMRFLSGSGDSIGFHRFIVDKHLWKGTQLLPHLSHSPGVLSSLINGVAYWAFMLCMQDAQRDVYLHQFFERLVLKGHSATLLKWLLNKLLYGRSGLQILLLHQVLRNNCFIMFFTTIVAPVTSEIQQNSQTAA